MTEYSDFGTFGRYQETPVDQMPADMRAAYNYTLKLRGVVPGPHSSPNSPPPWPKVISYLTLA